ncbi:MULTISPECIES: helix-turn-helix domain-containing protein [Flavobacterium]|uniref:Helix-turn-helix domain-containing protein n=2 Tax=Flavobacterium TaxID=237 RepID=A0ABW8PQ20_9FLAO|nr:MULTISPECIES: helix-turn-helix domain-containing protein [Flavobacterium]QYS88743.1 helix-turn-helix domain-containing protein [Flavobacterium davisii]RVU89919.1 XRE family transcriptional regulator [Flavobacterium columnare]
MKPKNNIKSLGGLTPEEVALLLGISHAQWALYELGFK